MDQVNSAGALPVEGLSRAVAQYGVPLERTFTLQIGERAYHDWQSAFSKRQAEVVVALRCPSGRYLVHTKAFYPTGTFRLLSGGIKPGEDLIAALERELAEETGLHAAVERFLAILHYRFLWQDQRLDFTSYVFLVAQQGGTPQVNDPHEAITAFRQVTLDELAVLAEQLECRLPEDWRDWGRFRALAHRLVVEVLSKRDG